MKTLLGNIDLAFILPFVGLLAAGVLSPYIDALPSYVPALKSLASSLSTLARLIGSPSKQLLALLAQGLAASSGCAVLFSGLSGYFFLVRIFLFFSVKLFFILTARGPSGCGVLYDDRHLWNIVHNFSTLLLAWHHAGSSGRRLVVFLSIEIVRRGVSIWRILHATHRSLW